MFLREKKDNLNCKKGVCVYFSSTYDGETFRNCCTPACRNVSICDDDDATVNLSLNVVSSDSLLSLEME